MKKQISKLILLMVPMMLLLSCNKDKFSEKDALETQQTIDLVVTVVDASSALAPVQGATVTIISDSTVVSKTTNSNGTVVFPNIKIGGDASISVAKTDFTSVLQSVQTDPDSYRQTQVSALVMVYSLSSDKLATFNGRLTMQSDLTNRLREPAVGVTVKARNNSMDNTQIFTALTDADGKYAISVPVSSGGDQIELFYPEFTVNQTLAFVKDNQSIAVGTRSVLYKSNSSPVTSALSNIPAIPSIYATVAPPAASVGSGFALDTRPNRVSLNPNSTTLLVDGGAGYNGGVALPNYLLSFSPDPNGVSSQLQVDIAGGKIINIDGIINNGATYSSAPTLNLNVLSATTQASINLYFATTYKVFTSNRGTGYIYFPLVSVETETFSSGTRVKAVDPNVNDASGQLIGYNNFLSSYSTISGGIIKSNSNGDTLVTSTNYFSAAPVFSVANLPTKNAVLSLNTGSINADSTLASITVSTAGLGYNPSAPPAVTLTTLASYGSGAVAKATVTTSGTLSSIYITNPGKKYVKNVNDYRNTGVTGFTYDEPSYPSTNFYGVKPGDIFVQDVYYGTGNQITNQSNGK